jgi:hypothetical protein
MKRYSALVVVFLCVVSLAAWAQAPGQAYKLEYKPKVGETAVGDFSGKFKDAQLGAATFGDVAGVSCTMKREVTCLDPDTGDQTIKITLQNVQQTMAGHPQDTPPPAPSEMLLTRWGEIKEKPGAADKPLGDLSKLMAAGLPLDKMACMALGVTFCEAPVKVGDSWTTECTNCLPIMGKTKMKAVTTLVKVEGTTACLDSDVTADVAPFEATSEQFGTLKIQSGTVKGEKLHREFDMCRSVVTRASGSLRLELQVEMGFGPMPVAATVEFGLKPAAAGG